MAVQQTPARQRLTLLGSTGSIGTSTLQVLALHPGRYEVFALSGNLNTALMAEQVAATQPRFAVMNDAAAASDLQGILSKRGLLSPSGPTEVLSGSQALDRIASSDDTDIIVAGIVGAAGLTSTLAAAKAGKRILLANKEALVMCGELLMNCAHTNGAIIMPVDSEHNAIFQCLPQSNFGENSGQSSSQNSSEAVVCNSVDTSGIEKIILTASGGPFRGMTKEQLSVVSRQQALEHPNWKMGPKITIDSATLMNKGLEVIEACYLFGVDAKAIEVVVHPQSVVHSMVRYVDGSVLAQMGQPDMKTPIAHALAWPERIHSGVSSLDLVSVGKLDFEAPDFDVFPCLRLAFEALELGGTAAAIVNAANEVAVQAFLDETVSFIQLPDIIEETLASIKLQTATDLNTILTADGEARRIAASVVGEITG